MIRTHQQRPAADLHAVFWNAPIDSLLDRKTVAAGISRSRNWLEQAALRGGFVAYLKIGNRCLYRKADVLDWLGRKGQFVTTTSELRKVTP